ncbi:shikimate 3-dehydrogenase (NADP+) [Teratosphaeria destructans]|uniref:Shikimate 3-dehydrogenase (NADP+) n=1 Tax=Teratosphaeria destructans TaxID=418781 RepID=A0A9W7W503_9PEZI|nr:shikimate 3-dehydrogenase (NADP+) [Teratosphaeria destructans]
MTKNHGVMRIEEIIHNEAPRLLVLFDDGQEVIVKLVADILGQKHVVVGQLDEGAGQLDNVVVGLDNSLVSQPESLRRYDRVVLTTHCVDGKDFRDERVTTFCDYEYLYTRDQGVRRDLARYLGFVLGQMKPHDDLKKKARTTLLSTTFPDIRAALPNIDILSVGADSVELRVDLLESPSPDGTSRSIPSIEYVGEQVMILRQRTELPIIFTIRCTKENGRFPMDDPMLQYQYLHKAKQWGCEYIDVELWLPEEIRCKLANGKGSSKIISAWHDFSGTFKWSSPEARRLFTDGAVYGDVVKMIALVNTTEENYELEYFRSIIQTSYSHPPFSGLNMGPVGQLSRTLNKVFTPITHPLLPIIAAPGQLSAAEINSKLHSMGQMPKTDMYAIGNIRKNGQATFFEKCLNELSVPHQLQSIDRPPHGSIEHLVRRPSFGGAFINPSLPAATAPYLPRLSTAASAIGQIDTVVAHMAPGGKTLIADNATWKGIRATLTTEFVPSAYVGQAAVVLASHEAQASAALFALSSLDVGAIYTIGFLAKSSVAADVQQFRGVEDMKKLDEPFVLISALPSEKSFVVSPLLKHYSHSAKKFAHRSGKVFVDLSNGISGNGDSVGIARSLGWVSYGVADVNAWTMVETLRLLVGQNVPFDFASLLQQENVLMAAIAVASVPGDHLVTMMSRPQQIGIDRLPMRRPSTNEPKEAMNCKSCRKRKIKCNRIKPSCEACQVFRVPCIYDATPKKRGPKTDVLEALVKRVNGLEKRLKDEKQSDSSPAALEAAEVASAARPIDGRASNDAASEAAVEEDVAVESPEEEQQAPAPRNSQSDPKHPHWSPPIQQPQDPVQVCPAHQVAILEPDAFAGPLIDTYFARLHGKPYYILDEPATRQRLRLGQLPRCLVHAIFAVSVRYAPHLCGGHDAAIRHSHEYTAQARSAIDVDEPTIEHLQSLLLLVMASFQAGRGKKGYMLLSHAISMALALNLHRELPTQLKIAPSEREGRRKLFWSCYIMDRFTIAGSKRPCLISDDSIYLKMPAWSSNGSMMPVDGSFFANGSSPPHGAGGSNAGRGSGAMLVEIVRLLGVTNRYLTAGGVKGDSHFPWHAQSTLSRIRADLDYWAANTSDAFTSIEALFGQPDSTTLVLSKLIYHLVHCLVYRPFLPVDLAELASAGQHQSWQIDATNACFLHANAITELVEIGRNSSIIDWPSFVGYCVCTAGTIHVHGAHYLSIQDSEVFSGSAEFLYRGMAQLLDLRFIWAGVQHQRETLQAVYASHSQLVKSLAANPMRFSPVFQMDDFFDRYPGSSIDGAHITFADVDLNMLQQASMSAYDGFAKGVPDQWTYQSPQNNNLGFQPMIPQQYMTQNQMPPASRQPKRRRTTNGSARYPTPTSQARSTMQERTSPLAHAAQENHQHNRDEQQLQTPYPIPAHDHQPNPPRLLGQDPTLSPSAVSPPFNFSPMQPARSSLEQNEHGQYDPFYGALSLDQRTPGGLSQGAESVQTDSAEKDPFLSLLEQLAHKHGCGEGGPSELDFFLSEQG